MGFLEVGTPLGWEESETIRDRVKVDGLLQFLSLWKLNKDRDDGQQQLYWGEEVEYSLVDINGNDRQTRVYLNAAEILEDLMVREHLRWKPPAPLSSDWHPEFGNNMIEAIPSPPYPLNLNSILMLERSMRLRRAKIQSLLPAEKFVTSQTAFPRYGLNDFMTPVKGSGVDPINGISRSIFVPDELMNPHPRFGGLLKNIKCRHGAKPFLVVPIFEDKLTYASETKDRESDWTCARPINELNPFDFEEALTKTINPVKGHIFMDCFAFGMGMTCVQTTFATPDCSSARYLYDQLTVLAPLFLALTASTPILRGMLSDFDSRWPVLEQAVDCRNESEMQTIPKSRYSGVSLYISDRDILQQNLEYLNDTNPPINSEAKEQLMKAGVDEILATHYGHLWVRDAMVIFAEKVQLDNTKAVDHFENIQSTNWNSVRFKPPPPATVSEGVVDNLSPIGWRVEFRSPDNQLTDFDNAAGVALISVIAQMIQSQNLDLYIPMSMNDKNMTRSWTKNAVTEQKFHFRKDILPGTKDRSTVEMTLLEILGGSNEIGFKGLVPMCQSFVSMEVAAGRCNAETSQLFSQYCDLIMKRVSGELLTVAQYLRKFALEHPAYKHDSIVNETIAYDLSVLSVNIGFGMWAAPELHGDLACLIPVTPLPPSTLLPSFSSDVNHNFVHIEDTTTFASSEAWERRPKFRLFKKDMVVLNDIKDIYSSPIDSLVPNKDKLFLPKLTNIERSSGEDEALTKDDHREDLSTNSSLEEGREHVSSDEDLTKCKDLDLLGHGHVEESMRKSFLQKLTIHTCPVSATTPEVPLDNEAAQAFSPQETSPKVSTPSTMTETPTCQSSLALDGLSYSLIRKQLSSGEGNGGDEELSTESPSSTEKNDERQAGDGLVHALENLSSRSTKKEGFGIEPFKRFIKTYRKEWSDWFAGCR